MFDPKIIHKRKRKAGLRIYDNSGLRDNLDDDQAKPLLAWAAAHAEKGAERTKHMEDSDAEAVIDNYVNTASHVVRLVNGLTLTLPEIESELEAEAVLQRLKESLMLLGGESEEITAVLNDIMANQENWDTTNSYPALMRLVDLAPAQPKSKESPTSTESQNIVDNSTETENEEV